MRAGWAVKLYDDDDSGYVDNVTFFRDQNSLITDLNDDVKKIEVYRVGGNEAEVQSLGRFVSEISMSYDGLGRLVSSTDGSGTTRYRYDLQNNITQVVQPGEVATSNTYDALDRKAEETNANGDTATWSYNYFGKLYAHQDRDSVRNRTVNYFYGYNQSGDLIQQTNNDQQDISYEYDQAGQVTSITRKVGYAGQGAPTSVTTYEYDLSGRRTKEKTVEKGILIQENDLAYNQLGQLTYVGKPENDIYYNYDTVGNRVYQQYFANYQGTLGRGISYYAYDAINRQVLVDGAINYDVTNNANLTGTQGRRVSYDKNGNRTVDTYGANGATSETYTYDALNRFTEAKKNGTALRTVRYDIADRVIQTYDGSQKDENNNVVNSLYTSLYDNKGRLVRQYFREGDSSMSAKKDKYTIFNTYDGVGNMTQSKRQVFDNGGFITTNATTYYRYDGSYKVGGITVTRSDAPDQSNWIGQDYDPNGYLIKTNSNDAANVRTFVNDANGQILQKTQGGNTIKNIVANGRVLATVGKGVDPDKPTNTDGSLNFTWQSDFNNAYQVADAAHPGTGPASYRVNAGDSLQSIALSVYGDAALWYLIADANGLFGNSDLQVGQYLKLPTTVGTVHNNDTTFKPYDSTRIIGDTTPNAPKPSSGSDCNKVGIIILAVLAAAVISIASAGLASAAGAGIIGFAVAGAVGGAVGSAASQGIMIAGGLQDRFSWTDVAVGAAVGLVGGALGGYAAGASKVGKALSLGQKIMTASLSGAKNLQGAGLLFAKVATYAVVNATANALGQGVKIAIEGGSFSWKSVAAAAIQGGVGATGGLGKQNSLLEKGSDFVFNNMGDIAANFIMNDGKFDPTQFVTDLAGNSFNMGLNAVASQLGKRRNEAIIVMQDQGDVLMQAQALSRKRWLGSNTPIYKAALGDNGEIGLHLLHGKGRDLNGAKLNFIGHNTENFSNVLDGVAASLRKNGIQNISKAAIIACGAAANDAQGASLVKQSFDILKRNGFSAEVTGHTGRIQIEAKGHRIADSITSQKVKYHVDGSITLSASKHVRAMKDGWLTNSTDSKKSPGLEKRTGALDKINAELQVGGYQKNSVEKNCEGAAREFIKRAEEAGYTGLKLVKYENGDHGFFVPLNQNSLARGATKPEFQSTDGSISGWEFGMHYRVRDNETGITYDPTFGTSGNSNPLGVKASEPTKGKIINGIWHNTTIYGGKIQTSGDGTSLKKSWNVDKIKGQMQERYIITDSHYQ